MSLNKRLKESEFVIKASAHKFRSPALSDSAVYSMFAPIILVEIHFVTLWPVVQTRDGVMGRKG